MTERWDVSDEKQRNVLAALLREACAKVFPPSAESFGSNQMDFYFHRLLAQLIENARALGIPAIGGDYSSLYRYCYERFHDYQADARNKKQPVSTEWLDEQKSIPVALSRWKKQFRARPRSASIKGSSITFHFVRGSAKGDWRLFAEVSRIPLADTTAPVVPAIKSLPGIVRLPPKGNLQLRPEDIAVRSKAIIEQRLKDLKDRSTVQAYRTRLEALPFEKLVAHDNNVRRLKKAKEYGLALAAIALIIGFMAYRVHRSRVVSVELVTHAGHFHVENIRVNNDGRIAQFSSTGDQLTPWVHVLENSTTGMSIRAVDRDEQGNWQLRLMGADSVTAKADIPARWRTSSAKVLQPEIQWSVVPGESRRILLYAYLDRRAFPGGVTVPGTDKIPAVFSVRNRAGVELAAITPIMASLTPDQTKWVLHAEIDFKGAGEHYVLLAWVRDAFNVKDAPGGGFTFERPRLLTTDLLWLNIVDGREPTLVNRPPPQTFAPMNVRFIRFGCGLPAQAYVTPQPNDNMTVNLSVIPDARRWPRFTELAGAVYGLHDQSTGIWYNQDRTQPYEFKVECDPPGYAVTFSGTLVPGDHTLMLEGLYKGQRLPSKPFTIRVRRDEPPSFVEDKNITALLPGPDGFPIAVMDARYKLACHCFTADGGS